MIDNSEIKKALPGFSKEIYDILTEKGKIVDLPKGQVLLKEGYFVNALPIVLDGLLKVTSRDEDREILLYYIDQGESCIMSYSACITQSVSKIFAITEKDSTLLMISTETLLKLIQKYPTFNQYFNQYKKDINPDVKLYLFDLDNPTKEIGRLKTPLMVPNIEEREGYVPNVLYSCGSIQNNGELVIPYAMSDYASTYATVNLKELLNELKNSK